MSLHPKTVHQVLGAIPAILVTSLLAACTTPKAEVPANTPAPTIVVDANCSVDGQNRAGGKVSINGWAVGDPKIPPQSISIVIGNGKPLKTNLEDRPDIAKGYQNPSMAKAGYRIIVDAAQAPVGAEIKIFANQVDKVHQCTKTFKVM